ncbi:hypothetical protein PN498_19295 [Oscillatoria sp. CS-180]|uniref:type II toxin-antitoxin system RelN family antitoxin n=1 Tax=Oscillatoria sp. CS-180 TaxID=3021720 RepID=UPI00232DE360|nr:hypothetical protein [Oscillatoria sp. CS-180]MDB9528147.1 hypothetical protein [Oscillatoria sp. CS-180]
MKAIEATATINNEGQLALDYPLDVAHHRRVRVIVLIPESEEDIGLEDSTETIIEGIQEGWQQALIGEIHPVSELWDRLDVE